MVLRLEHMVLSHMQHLSHNQATPTHTSFDAGHTAADENVPLNEVSFTDEEVSLTSTKIDVE